MIRQKNEVADEIEEEFYEPFDLDEGADLSDGSSYTPPKKPIKRKLNVKKATSSSAKKRQNQPKSK